MICPSCATAADTTEDWRHPPEVCEWPLSCTCQHGTPIEQDPHGDPEIPDYIDALAKDDPRRLAYEAKQGRKIP